MVRTIKFEWPELGVKLTAALQDQLNPTACDWLWSILPQETIMSNALTTGECFYGPLDSATFPKFEHWEKYLTDEKGKEVRTYLGNCPVKPGRVTMFPDGWQMIQVFCGHIAEPFDLAPIAQFIDEDLEELRKVNDRIWEGQLNWHEPKYYRCIISRLQDVKEEMPAAQTQTAKQEVTLPYVDTTVRSIPEQVRDWREVKKELDAEKKKIWLEEPLVVKRLAAGIMPYNPGHHNQYWTVYFMTWGIFLGLKQWPSKTIYFALRDASFTLDQCKVMVKAALGSGRYYFTQNLGDDRVMDLTWAVCCALPTVESKEDLKELVLSYIGYMGRYYFWIYHRMPSIGANVLRSKDRNYMQRLNELAEGAHKV